MKFGGQEVLEGTYARKQARAMCSGIPHCMVNREGRNFLTSLKADHKEILGDQALA